MKNIIFLLIIISIYGCEKVDIDTRILDIDGNEYHSIIIGDQEWMVEDLRVTHLNDGRLIMNITSCKEWISYNDIAYQKQGNNVLYNYYCVESGLLAPKGWHIASDDEWKMLEEALGISKCGVDSMYWRGNVANKIKDTFNLSDHIGINGYQGNYINGYYWWTSTIYDGENVYFRSIVDDQQSIYRGYVCMNSGFSVKCVRDEI